MKKKSSTTKNTAPNTAAVLDPDGLVVWSRRYVEHLRVRNFSERTIIAVQGYVTLFIAWAADRSVTKPGEVTKPILEAYQRWLFYFRRPTGKPLTFSSQRIRLQKLRGFFRFLARQNVVLWNPASDLELPRIERRLPRAILNEHEVEQVFAQPDLTDALGLRDRAMMEVLYSTGIRRHELAALQVFDVDHERGTVTVRLGKGKKDRVVPIGERALFWTRRYMDEARPGLVVPPDDGTLFLAEHGERLALGYLTNLMRSYVDAAKLGKTGACHIFRHSMATAMLDGGADVRVIQEILGHADITTTAIYTRVAIKHLKAVHDATHPAAKLRQTTRKQAVPAELPAEPPATEDALLDRLDQEAEDEDGPGAR